MVAYMLHSKFWQEHHPPAYGFYPYSMRVDIDALLAGGVKAFLSTVYVIERTMFDDIWPLRPLSHVFPRIGHIATAPPDRLAREYLDIAERMVEETRRRRGDVIEVARTFADFQRITGENKICMLHAIEGAHHLNGDIGMVDELCERGVCYMGLAHFYPNMAGGSADIVGEGIPSRFLPGCFQEKYRDHSGITPWGRELVDKLLDAGILVDPTHGGREYRRQVIEIARNHAKKRPVILSHVNVPADHSKDGIRPLPEDIREIADTGGVVGLMMSYQSPNDSRTMTGIESMLGGIDYLIQHGGEDVVAFGSDFDGNAVGMSEDLKSPRDYHALREAMLRKYTGEQVAKFMCGNAERALKNGWGK
jgi:microsomal dipeptidase-like Zn-dependent dipeptidase